MGKVGELSSIKPHSNSRQQGLHKLSPDLIGKARDETATQVTRIGLSFLGTGAFCLLSLLSPDIALLGGNEKINVPFAGPVSFFGFMLLGPAVLIVLRVYLQIYVEHNDRLDRLARSAPAVRAPTLIPLQNSLIRFLSGLVFYALLPLAAILFAWKGAAFPVWGSALGGVAVAVIASHVMLPLIRFSWPQRASASAGVGILALAVMLGLNHPLHRPFDLFRANLSGQWLLGEDFRKANLAIANLSNANLSKANLSGAELNAANLSGSDLTGAILTGADLLGANLTGANLFGENLTGTDLTAVNLTNATLSRANLSGVSLNSSNLTGANLFSANLSRADLTLANLSRADLSRADLSGADLSADLSGADLSRARLTGANLRSANLTGTDLRGVEGLTQTQLDDLACGDANTKLPRGFTLKPCETN